VYSAVLIAAMLVMLIGAVTAAIGAASSSSASEVSFLGAHIKTTSSGLVLVIIGAALAASLAVKKPPDIELFSPDSNRRPLLDRVMPMVVPAAAVIGVVGVMLLAFSVVWS